MSFINKMTSMLSNEGLNILPTNTDVLKKSAGNYLEARSDLKYQRQLNRKLPGSTDETYRAEKQRVADKMDEYAALGYKRGANTNARRMSMAETERQRLNTARENPDFRGEDGKLTDAGYDSVAGDQRQALLNHVSRRTEARNEMLNYGKDYFVGGDWKQNTARIGAATAALGTAAVGTRYMSGGSVTHNNQGRRDIAGIPFV